jgi:hypothetical protein
VQRGLHTAAIEGGGGGAGPLQTAVAIGKEQHRIAMHLPEAAQQIQRRCRQRYETVLVAFRIADMDTLTSGIDIPRRSGKRTHSCSRKRTLVTRTLV